MSLDPPHIFLPATAEFFSMLHLSGPRRVQQDEFIVRKAFDFFFDVIRPHGRRVATLDLP